MIRLEGVSKVYKGDVTALREVSVEIQRGEFVFLVGPSGSGKSTFLRLLNREEVADTGQLMVAGKDIGALRSWKVPYLRREIGYVFQDYKLLSRKTVYENVAFGLEVIGRPRSVIRKQVPFILELVGLTPKAERFPDELSGGEQQRVALARAFAVSPQILFADEPTGNLEQESGRQVADMLFNLRRDTGTALVLVTHDETLATRCDRICRMSNGWVAPS